MFLVWRAVFRRVKGVKSVLPGYSGGTVENPSYEVVCGGKTGHAESIQIEFDPKVISSEKILDMTGYFRLAASSSGGSIPATSFKSDH